MPTRTDRLFDATICADEVELPKPAADMIDDFPQLLRLDPIAAVLDDGQSS